MGAALCDLALGTAVILGVGIVCFWAMNPRKTTHFWRFEPETGTPIPASHTERGTRRSRWTGYCTIAGALLGFQLPTIWSLFSALQYGQSNGMAHAETVPVTMVAGLLVGLIGGHATSYFLTDTDPEAAGVEEHED